MQDQTYVKQKSFRYNWLYVAILFLSSWNLFAQNHNVTGTVTDAKGEPIPGVTVVAKGTTIVTITDKDGNFKLSLPFDAKTLA